MNNNSLNLVTLIAALMDSEYLTRQQDAVETINR